MAIIDRVKYDGPGTVLIWRHPPDDLTWGTQVIVNQSQEALFFKGGQLLDILGPGTHTLETANIPLLRTLIKLPFGNKTPFAAEIYFVNKAANLDVKWGTTTPIQLQDPKFNVLLPVRAHGQFGIRVADSRKLVVQLSGTMNEFTVDSLSSQFRGMLLTRIKDYLAETVIKQKVTILEINAYLEEISEMLQKKVENDFAKFGVQVVNFFVNSIDAPETDESVVRLKKAMADKAEMDILGEGYKTKRTFDTMEKAAGAEGSAMGAGMGLGMGVGAGAGMGQIMGGVMGQAAAGSLGAKTACPSCRAEAPSGAKFCPSCGKPMAAGACPHCKAEVAPGAKFCPSCGKPQ
ncbi:MAG: SPFH domain-containing protein [Elusimicrobiota bacterium]|jgi:membrane protease subunit (stomatin/prohibitin family)